MVWWIANYAEQIGIGVVGGFVGAGVSEALQYLGGWYNAGRNKGADFHIAATMYPRIDPSDPTHKAYLPGLQSGKIYAQELVWLGAEQSLRTFLDDRYLYSKVLSAMASVKDAGVLLGEWPERVERIVLKKIIGYHNSIPNNTITHLYKQHVGTHPTARVTGISVPTHENYEGSPHRRVLRSIYISDTQISHGLPPREQIYFGPNSDHAERGAVNPYSHRYDTLMFLIEKYRQDPSFFKHCRAYF